MDLVTQIYQLTKCFPNEEVFGLTSQVRRSAVSIPANIAEGHGRLHRADYIRYLSIARGSLTETQTHLLIALNLKYITTNQLENIWKLFEETGKLLNALIKSLKQEKSDKS